MTSTSKTPKLIIKTTIYSLIGIFWITFLAQIYASPRLITDNRIENLNGFPSIGRGYNLQSNRLQSMCFSKLVKNKPTFDLNYDVEEVTQEFFADIPEVGKKRLEKINVHFFVNKYYKKNELDSTQATQQLKNLLVRVEIRNYYHALDETQSQISSSARQLLENQEYVTFFNSCGQHYVRSVGSFSSYLALLQYRLTTNEKSDKAFAQRIEKGLFNFSGDKKVEKGFSKAAEARGMRVFVQALGLSKGELVNLVPVDINQFRTTVQDTVKLMQDPSSGLVSYIEVVPWVENPELSVFISSGIQGGGEQFIKLQRLEANSGVITEINRISSNQIEQYHIASMCKKILFENYMDKTNRTFFDNISGVKEEAPTVLFLTDIIDQKTRSYDMDKTLFYNLAYIYNEDVFLTLREFIQYFAKFPPSKLFEANKTYLYGKDGNDGAIDCMDKLYERGLTSADYRKIPSCVKSLNYIKSQTFFLDQYCLPKAAKLIFKGEKIEEEPEPDEEEPALDFGAVINQANQNKQVQQPTSLESLMADEGVSNESNDTTSDEISNPEVETKPEALPSSLEDLMQ
ncbi:MAG: hypothetical protein HOC24_12595 [Deltaproteobacteria bacterium]|jgi:hypothetical protein|nr:hypothetical protein [Deltaproteobacteria bacterium]